MARIEWVDSFSVKNDELDGQHKRWIEIINSLHDALTAGNSRDSLQVNRKSLKSMADYASRHFFTEEEYMAKIGFPGLEEHRELHNQFTARIIELLSDMKAGHPVLNSEMMKTVMDWLLTHILLEDKKYSQFASTK